MDPYKSTPEKKLEQPEEPGPARSIGGWLLFLGFSLLISPFSVTFSTVSTYMPMLSDGSWEAMTTPGTVDYSVFWWPLLCIELLYNAFRVLSLGALAYAFVTRHYLFPRLFIWLAVLNIVFIGVDNGVVNLIMDLPLGLDMGSVLGRPVLRLLIWGSYLSLSTRAAQTFVLGERRGGFLA